MGHLNTSSICSCSGPLCQILEHTFGPLVRSLAHPGPHCYNHNIYFAPPLFFPEYYFKHFHAKEIFFITSNVAFLSEMFNFHKPQDTLKGKVNEFKQNEHSSNKIFLKKKLNKKGADAIYLHVIWLLGQQCTQRRWPLRLSCSVWSSATELIRQLKQTHTHTRNTQFLRPFPGGLFCKHCRHECFSLSERPLQENGQASPKLSDWSCHATFSEAGRGPLTGPLESSKKNVSGGGPRV